jgi:predicted DnaQ family exonuclease/DinG family helicase
VATYVALDLETTGLDPSGDVITEVGAVRFGPDGVEDTFTSLVNPQRPVPYRIQMLTGIASEELAEAPPWEAVAPRFQEFLADYPVVGQNVAAFDLRFLDAAGIRHSATIYDTHELAVLLLPLLGEYNLAALARHFAIPMPSHHRALPDAQASRELFLALRACASSLPPAVLAEAARLAGASRWPGRTFFAELLDEAAPPGLAPVTAQRLPAPQPLVPHARRQPVDPSEVAALLSALRTRPDVLPGFEERPEQQAMARAVAETFNEDGQLVVEAGTGIGKSLAYLLPAACHALRNNARVVISTATINLQDQLIQKDIPAVQTVMHEGATPDCRPLAAAQLKGKRNYLCLRRHLAARHSPALSDEEARFLLRLLLWLTQTETGDRTELRLSRSEETLWHRLSAQNEDCLGSACPFVADGSCFLVRARRRAEAAHLVVVNHALLLSDVVVAGRLIPPYDHLILDEAHHLEEQATRQLGFEGREADLIAYLDRLHRRTRAAGAGLTAAVRQSVRGLATPLGPAAHLSGLAAALGEAADRARTRLREFTDVARAFIRQHAEESGDYEQRLLLTAGIRAQPDCTAVEMAWENLALALSASEDLLAQLHTALGDAEGLGLLGYEGLLGETAILLQTAQQLRGGMTAAIQRHDPSTIQWLAEGGPAGVGVGSAPLDVAPLLQERLYADKRSIVLTSATLATRSSFRYIRQRLGMEDAHELLLGSPFDYQQAALILLPTDLPEPNHRDYPASLQGALVQLCRASQGRALALFTSHASLRTAHAAIRGPLGEQGIAVLGQGIDGTPQHLLQSLKRNAKTLVLGTASFWEGVDVVGEALSLLVLARLPFSVPSEPIFAARSAQFEDPFNEYALPQAVLRFKQGFGRLIRSKTDRGVVVVLDRRIKSKAYGRTFLESLPPCPVEEAPLDKLPQRIAAWLEGKGERGA